MGAYTELTGTAFDVVFDRCFHRIAFAENGTGSIAHMFMGADIFLDNALTGNGSRESAADQDFTVHLLGFAQEHEGPVLSAKNIVEPLDYSDKVSPSLPCFLRIDRAYCGPNFRHQNRIAS